MTRRRARPEKSQINVEVVPPRDGDGAQSNSSPLEGSLNFTSSAEYWDGGNSPNSPPSPSLPPRDRQDSFSFANSESFGQRKGKWKVIMAVTKAAGPAILVLLALLAFEGELEEVTTNVKAQVAESINWDYIPIEHIHHTLLWFKWNRYLLIPLITFATTRWAYRVQKRRWSERDFVNNLSVILVTLNKGREISVQTILEVPLNEVVRGNRFAAKLIRKSAKKTTEEAPFLHFPRADYWVIKNYIITLISREFSKGSLMKDMNLPTKSEWYVFSVCFIKSLDTATKKLRVYLVKERNLLQVGPNLSARDTRRSAMAAKKVLLKMATLEMTVPDSEREVRGTRTPFQLGKLELTVPLYLCPKCNADVLDEDHSMKSH